MPEYRGGELDPDRGPGLGCFWFQVIVLAVFLVLVPIGYNLNWPFEVLAVLLFIILGLLLFVGQTLIFLLRLVAADRRTTGRRRPLASTSKTVGQLEDERRAAEAAATGRTGGLARAPGGAGAAGEGGGPDATGAEPTAAGAESTGVGGHDAMGAEPTGAGAEPTGMGAADATDTGAHAEPGPGVEPPGADAHAEPGAIDAQPGPGGMRE